ncbi:CheB methylesterase domain-containing protein [Pseudoponticoccus marisrubri]|uniref:protein-glutamate methylesterase n=1 Tax=Pseudoponticoccus marisrubri TaxID=1685382 RepID=A0A0W7WQI8_9RHOB|nr:CheB methylesterase domain-containing protein [Pseudoponticoccus marisrubri]KUF12821.1 hypothetical protein AVJ23_03685 [Pseudoponticoccus marisrubri]
MKTVIISAPNPAQGAKLARAVDAMTGFRVVARASDLMGTFAEVEDRLPDAVLIAEALARLPEFEVMRALFSAHDVRWLVITAAQFPQTPAFWRQMAGRRRTDLMAICGTAPVGDLKSRLLSLTRAGSQPHVIPARRSDDPTSDAITPLAQEPSATDTHAPEKNERVILIGASTGGVDALITVLSDFDRNCPPTLIVQHTGTGFGASLADLLDRQSAATVRLAGSPAPLRRGEVTIGAGLGEHLCISPDPPLRLCLQPGPPVSGHRPSVDMLFHSAVRLGTRISAALLTGMGRDGAEGLKALRDAGALTVAQNEASSVVYGMPRAAVELGAAQITLPLDRIGKALLSGHMRAQPQNARP